MRIMEGLDELIWCIVDNDIYSPKAGYLAINDHRWPTVTLAWWWMIWKLNVPPRTRLFFWCVLSYKVPTGDQLSLHAFHDPSLCVLCKQVSESIDHLFLKYDFSKNIWESISNSLQSGRWDVENVNSAWRNWCTSNHGSKLLSIPLLFC